MSLDMIKQQVERELGQLALLDPDEFSVPLNQAWKILGYAKKDTAITIIYKNFIRGKDYEYSK